MKDLFNSSKYWAGQANVFFIVWLLEITRWALPLTPQGAWIFTYGLWFAVTLALFFRAVSKEQEYERELMSRARENIERIERGQF